MKPISPPRRLIIFSGPQSWAIEAANSLLKTSNLTQEKVQHYGQEGDKKSLLGQDMHAVVINAYMGFNPNIIGQLSGTIVAGGALMVICPSLEVWHEHPDPEKAKLAPYPMSASDISGHYLSRWASYLKGDAGIEIITAGFSAAIPPIEVLVPVEKLDIAISQDQSKAIQTIEKVIDGQRKRPAIIVADRGRGKSAALGLAAAKLLVDSKANKIIVTASGFQNALHVFKHAHAALDQSTFLQQKKCIQTTNGSIQYLPLDQLIATAVDCDILLVDEAASLGVQRLEALLKHYSRIAFASTEHGYEGSGRGFSIKFKQLVTRHCRGHSELKLRQPIRWGENDPLERWMNEILLLQGSEPASLPEPPLELSAVTFEPIKQSELANHSTILTEVFKLLVDAHYQTRPSDLRYLLDAPSSQLWVAKHNKRIVGLAWLMLEGGLEQAMADQITAGNRRPQGHLAPQIIAAHIGLSLAATLTCARVQRIVVSPKLQNLGIGQAILKHLTHHLEPEVDYLASSFGADAQLVRFWNQAGFHAVRLSDKANPASGLHSALVIKPLSEKAEKLAEETTWFFTQQLLAQLSEHLRYLSPLLVRELTNSIHARIKVSQDTLDAASLFAYQQRPYESTLAALNKIAELVLYNANSFDLDAKQSQLFIMKCLQKRDWQSCANEAGLSGKSECVSVMRKTVGNILEQL